MIRWMMTLAAAAWAASAQPLDNAALNGRHFFRTVAVVGGETRSALGQIDFDGRGGYTVSGQQNTGANAAANLQTNGTYAVRPTGIVTLSHPLIAGATINARLGVGGVVGSSTESAAFDVFLAIQAPTGPVTNATFTGAWQAGGLEAGNGTNAQIRNTFFRLQPNGQGAIGNVAVQGQQGGQSPVTQTAPGVSYLFQTNGAGSLIAGAGTPFLNGTKAIYLGGPGNTFLLGGSTAAGIHDVIFAVRAPGASPAWNGLYAAAGLRFDQARPGAFAGTINALGSSGIVQSRRVKQPEGLVDFTGVADFTLGGDGTGGILRDTYRLAIGQDAHAVLSVGVSSTEPNNQELFVAFRARPAAVTGNGANPQGILNAASFAPIGNPLSPGGFTTLFGTGLADATIVADRVPFPTSLGGTEVLVNNVAAPVYVVSPAQISFICPSSLTGANATVTIRRNNQTLNSVEVPLAPTAPGIFSLARNGIGAGAILKPDFTVVGTANRVRRGETILIYLTGLGALNPPVADGAAASTTVLSRTVATVNVYIGGRRATVAFAGAAPGLAGLYQINAVVPNDAPLGNNVSLAVETPNAFHDMVDIAIQQ